MQRQEGSNRAQQQPRNALTRNAAKKRPWYGRALDCLHLWMQPAAVVPPPARALPAPPPEWRLRWWASVKAAALALARVLCLCTPVCSYESVLLGVHVDAVVPRTRPRSGSSSGGVSPAAAPTPARTAVAPAREGPTRRRASFRGRSLTDDALMRRFVLDELTARRRGEMEAVHVKRRRLEEKWQPPGKSRLRRMSLAVADAGDEE